MVKELKPISSATYVVSRNDAEAEKDRADRQAIVAGLEVVGAAQVVPIGRVADERFVALLQLGRRQGL